MQKKSIPFIFMQCSAFFLSLLFASYFLRLDLIDWNTPISNQNDSLMMNTFLKGAMSGHRLRNPFSGMPDGSPVILFPALDIFHYLLFRIMGFFTTSWQAVLNLYWIATFPAIAMTASAVIYKQRVHWFISLLGGLIFSFLPYHFDRLEHLFVLSYTAVPLGISLIISSYHGDLWSGNRRKISTLCFALLTSFQLYYGFFTTALICVMGLIRFIETRKLKSIYPAAILALLMILFTFTWTLPYRNYIHQHQSKTFVERTPYDSEQYGMKIIQILLPIEHHRISPLAKLRSKYNKIAPFVNENSSSSSGIAGAIGFMLLLMLLLMRSGKLKELPAIEALTKANISAVLLGTTGGFGALFAYLISPQIRAYNRISIFISFFAICTLCILANHLYTRKIKTKYQSIFLTGLSMLTILALFDQTSPANIPNHKESHTIHQQNTAFIEKIETIINKDAMIFQLPVLAFPEGRAPNNMGTYDHLTGYLSSNQLKWSFGAMKNSSTLILHKSWARKPAAEFIKTLRQEGFKGLYIDMNGYSLSDPVLTAIQNILGKPDLIHPNGHIAFYQLPKTSTGHQKQSIHYDFISGASTQEQSGPHSWNWCAGKATLMIINRSLNTSNVTIKTAFTSGSDGTYPLSIRGPGFTKELNISHDAKAWTRNISLAPGATELHFSCPAPPLKVKNDQRILVFQIHNLEIKTD